MKLKDFKEAIERDEKFVCSEEAHVLIEVPIGENTIEYRKVTGIKTWHGMVFCIQVEDKWFDFVRIDRELIEKGIIGEFACVSGKLRITDPCYDTSVWCSGELDDVKTGRWYAKIEKCNLGKWGSRIQSITAFHSTYDNNDATPIIANFEVGVDSGQAGIFDSRYYQDASVFENEIDEDTDDKNEKWYNRVSARTLSDERAGVIPYGAVSSSGFGDGSYTCRYIQDENGEVVWVSIEFITDEEIKSFNEETTETNSDEHIVSHEADVRINEIKEETC